MRRANFIELVAVQLDLPLDEASRITDLTVPIEAYDDEHEIPLDDVETWLTTIREELA